MFEFLLRRHISDTTLIQYRAGLIDKERFDMLEAHLLLCPTCQLQLGDLAPPVAAPRAYVDVRTTLNAHCFVSQPVDPDGFSQWHGPPGGWLAIVKTAMRRRTGVEPIRPILLGGG
jgi:hypothetical protein